MSSRWWRQPWLHTVEASVLFSFLFEGKHYSAISPLVHLCLCWTWIRSKHLLLIFSDPLSLCVRVCVYILCISVVAVIVFIALAQLWMLVVLSVWECVFVCAVMYEMRWDGVIYSVLLDRSNAVSDVTVCVCETAGVIRTYQSTIKEPSLSLSPTHISLLSLLLSVSSSAPFFPFTLRPTHPASQT